MHRSLFNECYRRRRSSPIRASPLRRIPSAPPPPPLANSSASAPMLLHTSSARKTVTIKDAATTSDMPACSSSSGSRSHRYSMSKLVFPSGLSPPVAVGSWSASSKSRSGVIGGCCLGHNVLRRCLMSYPYRVQHTALRPWHIRRASSRLSGIG